MGLYPETVPFDSGLLDVGDGNLVYWEVCGNPQGKPAVVLHGGPGSGCTPWHRRFFDPDKYRIVLFDQRNSGRSTPYAGRPEVDLSSNNTWNLVADIERLREHLEINKWLVFGGSWGSVLALAYAESHPNRVSEMILFGVATGRHKEFDWLFRGGLSFFFPQEWERLRTAFPMEGDVVEGYSKRLHDLDPLVRQQAATEWCMWESATPAWPPQQGLSPRFKDSEFALAFARIVTHYVRHNAWIEDESLLRDAHLLARIPGILINGRFDFQSPLGNPWELAQVWKKAELVVVEDAGHSAGHAGITAELVRATDRFAENS